jgi:hypothetical protein
VLPAVDRLDEVTGIGREVAQAIIAEIGLHMSASLPPATPRAARRAWATLLVRGVDGIPGTHNRPAQENL